MGMLAFAMTIHARPAAASSGPTLRLAGRDVVTLALEPAALAGSLFDCDFETALARLAALERMYCEPDGSFVWTSSSGEPTWQVDGNLYDRAGRLSHVDLQGACHGENFDRLLAAFGWPGTALVFLLKHEAVVLEETVFRSFAQHGG
jgi:hypothetical protein